MPFFTDDGEALKAIDLAQRPAIGFVFDVRTAITYRDPVSGRAYRAPAVGEPTFGESIRVREPGVGRGKLPGRTDLASVPQFLWGFIASYGRQSAPAIVHDHQSWIADNLSDDRAAYAQRREDDRVLRTGLREQGVPLVRAWLMWCWVSVGRYWRYRPTLAALLIAQVTLSAAVVIVVSVVAPVNLVVLPLALVPLLLALPWGRDRHLVIWLSYSLAFVGPLALLALIAVLPFRIIEAIAEVFSGGDPRGVVQPTLRG